MCSDLYTLWGYEMEEFYFDALCHKSCGLWGCGWRGRGLEIDPPPWLGMGGGYIECYVILVSYNTTP